MAIVSYSKEATVDSGLTEDAAALQYAIDALTPAGGTDIQQALYRAQSILESRTDSQRKAAVILMSDGEPTYFHPSLEPTNENQLGTGGISSADHVKYTVLQAMHLKQSISNLDIYTIGFNVTGQFAKATLMPTAENASTFLGTSIVESADGKRVLYEEYVSYKDRKGNSHNWHEWTGETYSRRVRDEITTTSEWRLEPNLMFLPPNHFGNYEAAGEPEVKEITSPDGNRIYRYRTYKYESIGTLYRSTREPIAFNHAYYNPLSTITDASMDAIVNAFTKIAKDITEVSPNVYLETGEKSDIVIKDIIGDGFELVAVPDGASYDENTKTLTWTIPGSLFDTMDADATTIDQSKVYHCTFDVRLKDTAQASTYKTNEGASVDFKVIEENPFYNGNEVALTLNQTGSITLEEAYGTVQVKHLYADGTPVQDMISINDRVGKQVTFNALALDHHTVSVNVPDEKGNVSVTINRDVQEVVYVYTPVKVQLTVGVEGSGTVAGAGTYDKGAIAIVEATPAEGWSFKEWKGAVSGSLSNASITMDSNKSVVAVFVKNEEIPEVVEKVELTTSTIGEGIVTAGGTYDKGAIAIVEATPAEGWSFKEWTGAVSGTLSNASITMDSNKSVVAVFVKDEETPEVVEKVELTTSTIGEGIVTAGGTYDKGAIAIVEATPAEGWSFKEWTGAVSGSLSNASITMDSNKSVVAVFVKNEEIPEVVEKVELTTSTEGEGIVTAGGTYDKGAIATVEATPAEGWSFKEWKGAASGTLSNASITMDSNKSVVAVFVKDEEIPEVVEKVELTTSVEGSGTVSAGGTYDKGTIATVEATPTEGWKFECWKGAISGVQANLNIVMDSDKSVVAVFVRSETPVIPVIPVTPVIPTVPESIPVGPQGTVSIRYEDQDGNELASSIMFTGTVGTQYGTSVRSFEGYTLSEMPSNASGVFTSDSIVVIYRYSNDSIVVEPEEVPLGPSTDKGEEPKEETPKEKDSEVVEPKKEPNTPNTEEIVLEEENTPKGSALPKTGQLPIELFFGVGSVICAAGIYLNKKNEF